MGDLDVMEVAKFFMEKALSQNTSLSKNKLTDLLWQANGFWVGLTNRPLFLESFRYSEHRVLLLSIIDNYEIIMCTNMGDKINSPEHKYQRFLNKIWGLFGEYPDDFLQYLGNTIPNVDDLHHYKKIDIGVISAYFKNKLKDFGVEV